MTNRDHKQSVMSLLPLIAVLFIASPVRLIAQSSPSSAASAPQPAYSHELPAMDGNHLRVFVSDIEVAPGESSPPHSHPCVVIGHVAAGAFRHKVKGEGEDFYEAPNGVHEVFANVSDKDPARLIAIFVCEHETNLTVPPIETPGTQK